MATAPTTICTTNTITLIPGQSFILPGGSVIVSSSDVDSIDTLCADLTKIEPTQCYVVMFAGTGSDGDNRDEYFEANRQKIVGLEFEGRYIPFGSGEIPNGATGGTYNLNILWERIAQYIPGTSFGGVHYFTTSPNDSNRSALSIKTIPSIANNLQVVSQALADVTIEGGSSIVTYFSKFTEINALASTGVRGIPLCS